MKTVTVEYKLRTYPWDYYVPVRKEGGEICANWLRKRWHVPVDAPRKIWITASTSALPGESDLWKRFQITGRTGEARWGGGPLMTGGERALLADTFNRLPGYIYLKLEYEVRQ